MLSFQRQEEIRHLLLQKKSVTVGEIAKRFGVSDETVRRDLAVLCSEGFCTKTYGGASLATRSTSITTSNIKKNLCVGEKQLIAKIAASQIKPNDCIFLDHSTTVAEMCQEIQAMHLTVVTNSMWVIRELANQKNINLVVTGGNVSVDDQGMFGTETLNFLREHYFDKVFFSCKGLNLTKGIFDANAQVSAFRRALCEQSDQSYLLADRTKFGTPGFVHTMPFQKLDFLITDQAPNDHWTKMLEEHNVSVMSSLPE
ncbi:MAG: DeoR/GlpR family DNA-binding transcription regulator [Eubacteriales bacterium]|nr:DeoR/GlpR family DNA-binding transcription regulator [Eubacteriales bacterium]